MGCRSRGAGTYVASEAHNVAWGRAALPGATKGVLSLQGSHSVADEMFAADLARTLALIDAGYAVTSGDLAQTGSQGTFGNDTARTRVGQLLTFSQGTSSPVAATGKVHLLGTSGGATAAINYARQNPGNVASMYLMTPLLDLQDFYDNHTSPGQAGSAFTKAEIDTAYGGTFAAQVASHSPVAAGNQTALVGIPIRIAYSDNDQYVSTSSVATFVAAVNAAGGNATSYSLGSVLHNPATVDPADVVNFFRAHP